MKRKVVSVLLIATMAVSLLTGCNTKTVEYPTEETSEDDSSEIPTHLSKVIESNSGKALCNIEADVVADMSSPYPVYEIEPIEYSDSDLASLCDSIFDDGDYAVICPICCAGSEYIAFRSQQLENRKNDYIKAGKEVPYYIDQELKDLGIQERDVLPLEVVGHYTGEVKWYEIEKIMKARNNVDDYDLKYCFLEGKINGELFKVGITDYYNNITVFGFKENCNPEDPDSFTVQKNTDESEIKAALNEKNESECQEILQRLGIADYQCIGEKGAKLYGMITLKGQTLMDEKGVVRYYAPEVEGRTRPLEFYNDCFYETENYYKIIPTGSMMNFVITNTTEGNVGMPTPDSEIILGYESVYVCMDEDGVNSFGWSSPCRTVKVETADTQLLDFDAVIDRIEDSFKLIYSTYPSAFGGTVPEITGIELGMCRVTKGGKQYYMVPAWYIYMDDNRTSIPISCADYAVNAVDGSVVAVCMGGGEVKNILDALSF